MRLKVLVSYIVIMQIRSIMLITSLVKMFPEIHWLTEKTSPLLLI